MSKDATARVSIPGKIYELIWNDEEFYRDISQNKKTLSTNKFPRYDQWCTEEGLHMAFALAGYSISDIKILVKDNEITVSSLSEKQESDQDFDIEESGEIPERKPSPSVHMGVIVRGIARRNFKTKFVLHKSFDANAAKATMKNGLLEILIPKKKQETTPNFIEIKEN